MGGQQGRIIQALYDGKKMILQCSQLWNFGDEATDWLTQTIPNEQFHRSFFFVPEVP
jgi:hypothetical protein